MVDGSTPDRHPDATLVIRAAGRPEAVHRALSVLHRKGVGVKAVVSSGGMMAVQVATGRHTVAAVAAALERDPLVLRVTVVSPPVAATLAHVAVAVVRTMDEDGLRSPHDPHHEPRPA